jgi:hypothetical protein
LPEVDPVVFQLDASYPAQGTVHEENGVKYEVRSCA